MKAIRVFLSDEEVYDVPLKYIAENRANYIASTRTTDVDSFEKKYNEQYEYVMTDDFAGIDWFQNNMDWKDVKNLAIKVDSLSKPKDYEKLFMNAEMELVERV